MATAKTVDRFWEADLEDIETCFLGSRKVTDLPIFLDDRVPPQGSVGLLRTVDVDKAVDEHLAKIRNHSEPAKLGIFRRAFDRLIFG